MLGSIHEHARKYRAFETALYEMDIACFACIVMYSFNNAVHKGEANRLPAVCTKCSRSIVYYILQNIFHGRKMAAYYRNDSNRFGVIAE